MAADVEITSEETVPCRICGVLTLMTGTCLCNRCYELEKYIHDVPAIAAKILADVVRELVVTRDSKP